ERRVYHELDLGRSVAEVYDCVDRAACRYGEERTAPLHISANAYAVLCRAYVDVLAVLKNVDADVHGFRTVVLDLDCKYVFACRGLYQRIDNMVALSADIRISYVHGLVIFGCRNGIRCGCKRDRNSLFGRNGVYLVGLAFGYDRFKNAGL